MNLKEANARLRNEITEEHFWGLKALYILLGLHKDDFCKIAEFETERSRLKEIIRKYENKEG